MANILVIDDEVDICKILDRFLSKKGFGVSVCHKAKEGLEQIKNKPFDLVLLDFRLPDGDGLEMLKEIKALKNYQKVIIITGYSDIRMAVEVIKYGAIDYITKPLYPEELLSLINETLDKDLEELRAPAQEVGGDVAIAEKAPHKTKAKKVDNTYIIGKSEQSRNTYKDIEIIAPTPLSVIISGETGTGKEYAAREIHRLSKRADKPFVAIDCGALPKDIAGSEFFGHVKGAFTGAIRDKDGKFKHADGGTLFLDEIANLSYDIQVKLLRVLQEKKFSPIGGDKDLSTDVRILVASNEDLKEAVKKGKFREDLYYRLDEYTINLEPIRERGDDLEVFASSFIQLANDQLGRDVKHLSDEVLEKFKKYSWPGNLRELRNVIKRSVLLSDNEKIKIHTLPEEIVYHASGDDNTDKDSLKGVANEAERERILKVLSQTGNNKSKAAKMLNIDRKTLYNKLRNYNL